MFAYFRAPIGWGELAKRTIKDSLEAAAGRRSTYVIGTGSAQVELETFNGSVRVDSGRQES